jgi:hypothetical protein
MCEFAPETANFDASAHAGLCGTQRVVVGQIEADTRESHQLATHTDAAQAPQLTDIWAVIRERQRGFRWAYESGCLIV